MGEAVSQGKNCFNYQACLGANLDLAWCPLSMGLSEVEMGYSMFN